MKFLILVVGENRTFNGSVAFGFLIHVLFLHFAKKLFDKNNTF
ncbi:hypothetical protein NU08_0300 [Flavobacterium anhuiense]|uniref:Uncharacterized protein n=1 Tax=Flavobacterium anhuiense TaxID=459526 RepID=A0A444W512_9FLAO|nr:hypothetical protein NU08_0300 [Flavobacterium anhuiense]